MCESLRVIWSVNCPKTNLVPILNRISTFKYSRKVLPGDCIKDAGGVCCTGCINGVDVTAAVE